MRFGEFAFYRTCELRMQQKIELLYECRDVCYEWWADTVDCSVSFARQKYHCTFKLILAHLKADSHFVVIDRGSWGDFNNREHFEIGFRTMHLPIDYFLFIEVDNVKMPRILEKYGLILDYNRYSMNINIYSLYPYKMNDNIILQ